MHGKPVLIGKDEMARMTSDVIRRASLICLLEQTLAIRGEEDVIDVGCIGGRQKAPTLRALTEQQIRWTIHSVA